MVVCSNCGYSKSGQCKDGIIVCVDCGTIWPTFNKTKLIKNLAIKVSLGILTVKEAEKILSDNVDLED